MWHSKNGKDEMLATYAAVGFHNTDILVIFPAKVKVFMNHPSRVKWNLRTPCYSSSRRRFEGEIHLLRPAQKSTGQWHKHLNRIKIDLSGRCFPGDRNFRPLRGGRRNLVTWRQLETTADFTQVNKRWRPGYWGVVLEKFHVQRLGCRVWVLQLISTRKLVKLTQINLSKSYVIDGEANGQTVQSKFALGTTVLLH